MTVEPVEVGSPAYKEALALRAAFLRAPLGLELTADDTRDDAAHHHFGLFEPSENGRRLIGAVAGKPRPDLGPDAMQIRQMVVHGDHRGRGLGRRLLLGAEERLIAGGARRFLLFARDEATPFYERCGYRATGATETLIGLPHRLMEKRVDG